MAEWFETWFDTHYYHMLYRNRNDAEAQYFIDNLLNYIKLPQGSVVCDLACGKGRHARFLQQSGLQVTGLDLSPNNISDAQNSSCQNLQFAVHDIRDTYKANYFDAVFNLFTSFGYFETQAENLKAIQATVASIKPRGLFIIDYMNSRSAVENFHTSYIKTVDTIDFHISKSIEKGYIFKNINFTDLGQAFSFRERVKLLFLEDFQEFFIQSGLQIQATFGDYALSPYQALSSPRLIIICKKT